MPNWKTYESSVRLLSAILAAHPGLKLNYDEMSRILGDGTSAYALDHRFRLIKKEAREMLALANGTAIAGQYQQGASGKAISTRFERMKKKPCWDLSVDNEAADITPKKSPRKRAKSTPKKGKNMDSDDSEDDEEVDYESPSKKPAINKVTTGRITKTRGKSVKSYKEEDYDDDDVGIKSPKDEDEVMMTDAARNETSGNGKSLEMDKSVDVAVYNTDDEV